MSNLSTTAESVKVLLRVRPLNQNELSDPINAEPAVQITSANSLSVTSVDQKKTFQCSYDAVLGPFASQVQVYDKVKECTLAVMNGINATIFAYGQTGSGKTHSMYGPPNYINSHARETEQLGVIPRAINHIFEMARNSTVMDFQVHCSFVQIYNENLYDMLRDPAMNIPLTIREDKNEIYVQGLSEYNVKSVSDTLQLLKIAEDNRAIRETHMNQFSSRSHSIFQIFVDFKRMSSDEDATGEVTYRSKFNLVDLAGSEKWDLRRDLRDEHIAEMTNINLSLHTLGKCISALAKNSRRRQKDSSAALERSFSDLDTRSIDSLTNFNLTASSNKSKPGTAASQAHVPFRESKLTRLLQDSLGGSAKTFLIATVSPAKINAEESISTLKFADRAKQVMVQTVINESRPVDYAVVKKLQQELETLKGVMRRVLRIAGQEGVRALLHNPLEGLGDAEKACLQQALQDSGTSLEPSAPLLIGSPSRVSMTNESPGIATMSGEAHLMHRSHKALPPHDVRSSCSNNVEQGSGLEYVISLEKALNKEQVHAQHLTKKNETLIKELEELKLINMQLTYQQQQQQQQVMPSQYQHQPSSSSDGVNVNVGGGRGSFSIPNSEVQQVMSSVKMLMKQNEDLLQSTEQIQKVMKRFFKFQIEEEDMKAEINKIFDALVKVKAQAAATKVNDNFAFLEFSASASTAQPVASPSAMENRAGHTMKEHPSHHDHGEGQPSPTGKGAPGAWKSSHKQPQGGQELQSAAAAPARAPRNLPTLQQPQQPPTQTAQLSSKSGDTPVGHNSHNFADNARRRHHSTSDLQSSPPPLESFASHGQGHTEAAPGSISFRVRGGPAGMHSAQDQWLSPAADEMDDEERLRQELKKAKKKAKQQEKLQAWMKEKEDKTLAEQRAQEEEKKAMQEAELQKEAKRREYVQKQKAKLSHYQDRVKSEAEKIQELINLGIDPKSLNL